MFSRQNWTGWIKCIDLNGEKPQKVEFYADQMVLYARMKICFVLNVDGLCEEKNWNKKMLYEA